MQSRTCVPVSYTHLDVYKRQGLETVIDGGLCLGEGTGAVALLPLLDMAADIYREMSTFAQIEIEEYKPL